MGEDMKTKIVQQLKGGLKPSERAPHNNLFGRTDKPQEEEALKRQEETAGLAPVYSERVTLPLSVQQKELLDDLAKRLQRQRPERAHDFNRSSIIRAFLSLLNEDSFKDAQVSTESQLADYMKSKFNAR